MAIDMHINILIGEYESVCVCVCVYLGYSFIFIFGYSFKWAGRKVSFASMDRKDKCQRVHSPALSY